MPLYRQVTVLFVLVFIMCLLFGGCSRSGDDIPDETVSPPSDTEMQNTESVPGSDASELPAASEDSSLEKASDTKADEETKTATPRDRSWAEMLNLDEPAATDNGGPPQDVPAGATGGGRRATTPPSSPPADRANRTGSGPALSEDRGAFDASAFMQRHDANGDGVLTSNELPERWQRILQNADANNDGKITAAELKEFQPSRPASRSENRRGQEPRGEQRGDIFDRIDENGDGRLSASEMPERFWERLKEADVNSDGSVSRNEYEDYRPSRWEGPREPSSRRGRQGP